MAVLLAACTGAGGRAGPEITGTPRGSSTKAESTTDEARGRSRYVGTARCAACHEDIAASFLKTGHPVVISKVEGGTAPQRPFDRITGGVPDPPLGLAWDDIAYVIGGFAWKARYLRTDGFIVTGEAADRTQWNFANRPVGQEGAWVPYHPGEEKAYTCGGCHNTGWIPCPVGDDSCAHQDGLPGMAGSFAEAGVQCEACHGAGSLHAENPGGVDATIDRSAELCGTCHRRDPVGEVSARGGFIRHRQQYDELIVGAKSAMVCVDCHDPHRSVRFADDAGVPARGIRVRCKGCHVDYGRHQKSESMAALVACIDCHMPRITKSAWGDAERFTGDIRTHFFRVDPEPAQTQFTEDGAVAHPFVTVDWACRGCHRAGGTARVHTDEEFGRLAAGYHTVP